MDPSGIVEGVVSLFVHAPSPELTPFVGRRRELADLRRTLRSSRLVTMTGPGGVGKSRLAHQLISLGDAEATPPVLEPGSAMVRTVDLADVPSRSVVAGAVAEAMGLRAVALEDQIDHMVDVIGDQEALLLLDGVEHVRASCASLVGALLSRCSALRVLITSRQPLGIDGERVYPVPTLTAQDALELFLARASAVLPGYSPTPTETATVAHLCDALDRLPLALELAAARIPALPATAMLDRVEDRFSLLRSGPADRPARQRTLRASLAWSADLCTEQERILWARASVFRGGFDLEAAEEVCSGDGVERSEILDLISSLIDKSVLLRDPELSVPHYRMLESVREFGRSMLSVGDRARGTARHRDFVLTLAERCHQEWVGPRQIDWIQLLSRNHANLQAVLDEASHDPALAVMALRIATALELYWLFTGRVGEVRHWLDVALAHPLPPSREQVVGLGVCGYVAGIQRDTGHADQRLAEARALVEEEGGEWLADDVTLARLAFSTGVTRLYRGEAGPAVPAFEEALTRLRRAGYAYAEPAALGLLSRALDGVGRSEEAGDRLEECLALTEERGEMFSRSWALWLRSTRARDAGRLAEANDLALKSLVMKARLGDKLGAAQALEVLAGAAADARDDVQAGTMRGAAGRLWRLLGDSATARPYLAEHAALADRLAKGATRDRAYAAAYRRGQELDLDDAVAVALRPPAPPASPLTPREQQVAELIGEGLTDPLIARELVISVRTAEGHVERIRRKLGFSTRAQVAAWVARGGR